MSQLLFLFFIFFPSNIDIQSAKVILNFKIFKILIFFEKVHFELFQIHLQFFWANQKKFLRLDLLHVILYVRNHIISTSWIQTWDLQTQLCLNIVDVFTQSATTAGTNLSFLLQNFLLSIFGICFMPPKSCRKNYIIKISRLDRNIEWKSFEKYLFKWN